MKIPRRIIVLLGIVFAVLFMAEVVAVHSLFGSELFIAADFHSRWYGARALLLEDRDPYSPEVTAEIEAIRDPTRKRTNSFSFAFPLHVLFTFWPISYFSYDWAQSFWMVMLQWVVIAVTVVMMLMVGWKPTPLGIAGALLASILFYPAARTILLGQFTLHVTLFLALSIFFLRRGQDGWAGFWLAAASIKPQMVLLVGLWMVVWALFKGRYRFLQGVALGGAALLAGSLIWLPRWPLSFIEDVQRYAEVASGRNPLDVLGELLMPGNPGIAAVIAAGILILLTVAAWYWGVRDSPNSTPVPAGFGRFEWVLYWTMAVSLLVLFQTGSTNQAILFIPLFLWFWEGLARWGKVIPVLAAVLLIVGPWILFLATIQGNYENPILLLPLPFLCLIILGLKGLQMRRGEKAISPQLETAA